MARLGVIDRADQWLRGGTGCGRMNAGKGIGRRAWTLGRPDNLKGFVVLPRRWVVERAFSRSSRNRRLAKDHENLAATLTTFVRLAAIQLGVRRLARTEAL